MKTTEIDYTDVGTFPKFSKAVIRILLEMLKVMIKKTEPPALSVKGRRIFLTEHLMRMLGLSRRTIRRLRARDEIEYMISEDGATVFFYDSQIQEYLDRTFVSSRTPEGKRRHQLRNDRFNNFDTN